MTRGPLLAIVISFITLELLTSCVIPSSFANTLQQSGGNKPCTIEGHTLDNACLYDLRHTKIAVVNNFFTTTAYFGSSFSRDSNKSGNFYTFYDKYDGLHNGSWVTDTTDLNWLTLKLHRGWGYSYSLRDYITKEEKAGVLNSSRVTLLDDTSVSGGALFGPSGERLYDVVIVGFVEYVTLAEYKAYWNFVSSGGKLIILGSSTFIAQVSYNAAKDTISLVRGHGWYFNGKAAQIANVYDRRWYKQNIDWMGSELSLCCGHYRIRGAIDNTSNVLSEVMRDAYGNNVVLMKGYTGHEENGVGNSTDEIIAYWNVTGHPHWIGPGPVIAIYRHPYKSGTVIDGGIFATDILETSNELQFFTLASIVGNLSS